jgi:2-polyprenyl-3-methyl-5-hydroxy-6-metoxy-1,4-benzoquinol methylase
VADIDWDARYAADPALWGELPNQFVRARVADAEPGRAVDLGCGNGRNAVWLARRGWHVEAVDISAVGIEQAQQRAERAGVHVAWEVGDALEWQPAEPLDLVLVVYLHMEMPELTGLLARAATWLAPGGRLLYVGHSRTNIERGIGGPSNPAVLAEIADLAKAAAGLRVLGLHHLMRETEAGTAIDILLEVTTWEPAAGGVDPDPHHFRPPTP